MQITSDQEQCAQMILERTLSLSQGALGRGHPMVLSCGGIFVPRPRPINPTDPFYQILYTPSQSTPTKIVSALVTRDLLDDLMWKVESN